MTDFHETEGELKLKSSKCVLVSLGHPGDSSKLVQLFL